jgi:hypothetical protein
MSIADSAILAVSSHFISQEPAVRLSESVMPAMPAMRLPAIASHLIAMLGIACVVPAVRAEIYQPPGDGVTTVTVGFYLLNLDLVDEKAKTFQADLYLEFSWQDDRMKHDGTTELLFADDAVGEQFETMWWPQVEFVNSGKPEFTNESLEIFPNGRVKYTIGLTGTFRASLDLRRFPFDRQTLIVRLQSFLYDSSTLMFVPDDTTPGFEHDNTFEELRVTGVSAESRIAALSGRSDRYSEYIASIRVVRNWTFYLWTVFGPVVLIFLIACAIFLVPIELFADRVAICLTALLACIATHFAISFNLPHVGYLTVIDRLFVTTYGFAAVLVLVSGIELLLVHRHPTMRRRVNVVAAVSVPLGYLATVAMILLR